MARIGSGMDAPRSAASLVRAIHGASLSAAEWPDVLERLRSHLDAQVASLSYHDFTSGSDSLLFESPDDASFSQEMAAFSARNPWFLSSQDYVPGRVMTGDELISNANLRRTDFYRGFLKPRGLLHLLCGVVVQRARGVHFLSIYRAEDQGAFDDQARSELGMLLEHVTLSLESQWRWQEANDLARALLALTDHDANPLILVTAEGEAIHRNPAAEQLLQRCIGVRLEGSRLVAASAADQRLLRETIARVARDDAAVAPSVLTLASAPPAPPVVAVVRPAGQVFTRQVGSRRGLVMVTIRGGHAAHDASSCIFARQYELTAAQAKVGALVFAGQSLAMISLTLNLSENTVRSHLKQIFQKTGTHGQMELVHLHARVCPALS